MSIFSSYESNPRINYEDARGKVQIWSIPTIAAEKIVGEDLDANPGS